MNAPSKPHGANGGRRALLYGAGASAVSAFMKMNAMNRLSVLLGLALAAGLATGQAWAQPQPGNPGRGAALFGQCLACHSIEPGVHLSGPSLARIWGRRAGTVPGFTRYSEPLAHSGVTWDERTLDRWLEHPQTVIPGTLMTFPGLKDAGQRADVIAYLEALAAGQAPPPASRGMMAGPPRPDLKTVPPGRRVRAIRYCNDGYHVTTEDGRTRPFWEFNLRLKTDSSALGPPPGKPALVGAGMQGDRASIVFASPEEISRMVEMKCP
jgi:cytochrome c